MYWTIYLSGEIHSDWREKIITAARSASVPAEFVGPVLDHEASDDVGIKILGDGDLNGVSLQVTAHAFSASAGEKIAAAGGSATLIDRRPSAKVS